MGLRSTAQLKRLVKAAVIPIRAQRLRNQVVDRLLEIDHELGVQGAELRPDNPIEIMLVRPHHDRRPALTRIPIGPQTVLAAQCDKEVNRPTVRKGELHLDLRLARSFAQPSLQPTYRSLGRILFPCRPRAPEQRFKLCKLLAQGNVIGNQKT